MTVDGRAPRRAAWLGEDEQPPAVRRGGHGHIRASVAIKVINLQSNDFAVCRINHIERAETECGRVRQQHAHIARTSVEHRCIRPSVSCEVADSEFARAKRQNLPLSILVCDLNGFKEVNDRFGHLEGNKVLRSVAAALRESCREYDYVARMGGDEFVLVLTDSPEDVLQTKIARLAEAARLAGKSVLGEDLVSLSVPLLRSCNRGPTSSA